MQYEKEQPSLSKKNLVKFLKSLGIDIKTNTKARGNQGCYVKNRIDISKDLSDTKAIEVLVHEFAHHIHSQIDENFIKNGGKLETVFDTNNIDEIKDELINVTGLIEKNNRTAKFIKVKEETSKKIQQMQKFIKNDYPEFMRSKKFTEFEKYIKKSEAKYLLKYDVVKLKTNFLFFKKERIISINTIDKDFPDMPKAFATYIKLCSLQKKQAKISGRLNKMNKYYNKPTELFARFVQGYFTVPETIKTVAPVTTKRFNELLKSGYYNELKEMFELFGKID